MLIFKRKNLANNIFSTGKGEFTQTELIDIETGIAGEDIFVFKVTGYLDAKKSIKNKIEKIDIRVSNKKNRKRKPTTFERILMPPAREFSSLPKGAIEKVKLKDMATIDEIDIYQKASGEGVFRMISFYSRPCEYCDAVTTALLHFGDDLSNSEDDEYKENNSSYSIQYAETKDSEINLSQDYEKIEKIISSGGSLEKTFDTQNPDLVGQSSTEILQQEKDGILSENSNFIDGAASEIDPDFIEEYLPANSADSTLISQIETLNQATVGSSRLLEIQGVIRSGQALTSLINDSAEKIITAAQLYGQDTSPPPQILTDTTRADVSGTSTSAFDDTIV